MRRSLFCLAVIVGVTLGLTGPAFAANPPGPSGPPNQSCEELEPNTPGHAADSPGAPFNEAGINSVDGGISGQHYSESSQYDVACFQVAQH